MKYRSRSAVKFHFTVFFCQLEPSAVLSSMLSILRNCTWSFIIPITLLCFVVLTRSIYRSRLRHWFSKTKIGNRIEGPASSFFWTCWAWLYMYTIRWSNFDRRDPKMGVFLQSTGATPCEHLLKWNLTPENPTADTMFMAGMAMVLPWKIVEDFQSFVKNTKLWPSL